MQGLTYHPRWIDQATEERLVTEIDAHPWQNTLSRRTQQYGNVRYSFRPASVIPLDESVELPPSVAEIARRIETEFRSKPIDHLIVNEYKPKQGISPHIDHGDFDTVYSLSLLSPCLLDFYRGGARSELSRSLVIEPQSLLILDGEARWKWAHGIRARLFDTINGEKNRRKRRLSLTFRSVR